MRGAHRRSRPSRTASRPSGRPRRRTRGIVLAVARAHPDRAVRRDHLPRVRVRHRAGRGRDDELAARPAGVRRDGRCISSIQGVTAVILILAANTSFADFPRVASFLARDGFIPRQFANRGDRLVYLERDPDPHGPEPGSSSPSTATRTPSSRSMPSGSSSPSPCSRSSMVRHWLAAPGTGLAVRGAGPGRRGDGDRARHGRHRGDEVQPGGVDRRRADPDARGGVHRGPAALRPGGAPAVPGGRGARAAPDRPYGPGAGGRRAPGRAPGAPLCPGALAGRPRRLRRDHGRADPARRGALEPVRRRDAAGGAAAPRTARWPARSSSTSITSSSRARTTW